MVKVKNNTVTYEDILGGVANLAKGLTESSSSAQLREFIENFNIAAVTVAVKRDSNGIYALRSLVESKKELLEKNGYEIALLTPEKVVKHMDIKQSLDRISEEYRNAGNNVTDAAREEADRMFKRITNNENFSMPGPYTDAIIEIIGQNWPWTGAPSELVSVIRPKDATMQNAPEAQGQTPSEAPQPEAQGQTPSEVQQPEAQGQTPVVIEKKEGQENTVV